MRQSLTIAMYLALGVNAGTAGPVLADAADDTADASGSDDTVAADPGSTTRRVCPVAIPIPADSFDCQCFTTSTTIPRCAPITAATCSQLTLHAFTSGFITLDAVLYLDSAGFCPITSPVFPGVLAFCPSSAPEQRLPQ